MKITLGLRSDKPKAELYLVDIDGEVMATRRWLAHHELSKSLLKEIELLLKRHDLRPGALAGIVVYRGPGSFTGLRIGIALANALAYGLNLPIVGVSGSDWLQAGVKQLGHVTNFRTVVPEYGAPVHISQPKH